MVVVVERAEARWIGERGFDGGAVFGREDLPQGLLHFPDAEKGRAGGGVPGVAEAEHVVGEHLAATGGGGAGAGEGFGGVERAVVVGQLLAGPDVADREFEVVADGETVRRAGVVEETRMIPAENVTAGGVDVGVGVEHAARVGGERGDLRGGEALIERIEGPGYGALRNKPGGEDAPADTRIDEAELRVGVDHRCAGVGEEARAQRSTDRAGAQVILTAPMRCAGNLRGRGLRDSPRLAGFLFACS